jgi:hypothetical protein
MIQHGSVNNRRRFEEIAAGELSLVPVSASIGWGEKSLDAGSSGLLPGVFYRDAAEDHPFLFFADDDDEDDEDDIEEDDFDDVEDDFDDDFDEDDDFDDDEDDDFDDEDEEYDYDEDVDYDDFDE